MQVDHVDLFPNRGHCTANKLWRDQKSIAVSAHLEEKSYWNDDIAKLNQLIASIQVWDPGDERQCQDPTYANWGSN